MKANERAEKPVPHVNFDDGSESHQGRSVEGDLSRRGTPEHEAMHFFLLHLLRPEVVSHSLSLVVQWRGLRPHPVVRAALQLLVR